MASLLETTLNTRLVGGQGVLVRSDVIKRPSVRDVAWLKEHGVTTIIDLRTPQEVASAPEALADDPAFHCVHCPIVEGSSVPATPQEVPLSYMTIARAACMPQVFHTLAAAPDGALFHCSAGKDRTGVVSAILMLLSGAPDDAIIADHLLTRENNAPRLTLFLQRFPDADPAIITPQPWHMSTFLTLFRNAYGTAEAYLTALGLSPAEIASLQRKIAA